MQQEKENEINSNQCSSKHVKTNLYNDVIFLSQGYALNPTNPKCPATSAPWQQTQTPGGERRKAFTADLQFHDREKERHLSSAETQYCNLATVEVKVKPWRYGLLGTDWTAWDEHRH